MVVVGVAVVYAGHVAAALAAITAAAAEPATALAVLGVVNVPLDLAHVDVSNLCVEAVEYAGDFFQCGAFGLDVEEVDEDELDKVPCLVYWVGWVSNLRQFRTPFVL